MMNLPLILLTNIKTLSASTHFEFLMFFITALNSAHVLESSAHNEIFFSITLLPSSLFLLSSN